MKGYVLWIAKKDTGYDFIEVENINVNEWYETLSTLLRRHSYVITNIDNLGLARDGKIRTIHVHVRHAIFAPYVKHLIKKYLNI